MVSLIGGGRAGVEWSNDVIGDLGAGEPSAVGGFRFERTGDISGCGVNFRFEMTGDSGSPSDVCSEKCFVGEPEAGEPGD